MPLRLRLHRYSAWFLLLVIAGHVAATRGLALLYDAPPGQIGVAFAVAWLPWFFVPYYALLAVMGFYHSANGVVSAISILSIRVPPRFVVGPRFWTPIAVGSLLVLIGLSGCVGWLYSVGDPFDSDYARVYLGE